MSAEVSAHAVTREISTRGADLWYWFKHYLILRWQMMLMHTVHKVIQEEQ